MFLIGEVCGASRKASSNNEPTEVSRCHSSQRLKARGRRRRAKLNHTSKTLFYPMKGEKPKTSESCPPLLKHSSHSHSFLFFILVITLSSSTVIASRISLSHLLASPHSSLSSFTYPHHSSYHSSYHSSRYLHCKYSHFHAHYIAHFYHHKQ